MVKEICVLVAQVAVLIVLGVLVGLGHNSAIQDGLLAICGSIAGVGIWDKVRSSKAGSTTAPDDK